MLLRSTQWECAGRVPESVGPRGWAEPTATGGSGHVRTPGLGALPPTRAEPVYNAESLSAVRSSDTACSSSKEGTYRFHAIRKPQPVVRNIGLTMDCVCLSALFAIGCGHELRLTPGHDPIDGSSAVTLSFDGEPPKLEMPPGFGPRSSWAESPLEPKPSLGPLPESGITPSVKRTAAGLPEPLPGYPSWPILEPANALSPARSDGGSWSHLSQRIPYVSNLARDTDGTILLLEEKNPEQDFISQISLLKRFDSRWEAEIYARASVGDAFTKADASQCNGCHSTQ